MAILRNSDPDRKRSVAVSRLPARRNRPWPIHAQRDEKLLKPSTNGRITLQGVFHTYPGTGGRRRKGGRHEYKGVVPATYANSAFLL